eukprot:1021558-Rhodomonas_salina.2
MAMPFGDTWSAGPTIRYCSVEIRAMSDIISVPRIASTERYLSIPKQLVPPYAVPIPPYHA